MPVLGAASSPGSSRVARDVFDLFQRLFYVRLQLGAGREARSSAQRIARINPKNGLHVEVFAPLQELQQPHPIGGPVSPGVVHMTRTPGNIADSLFPVESRRDRPRKPGRCLW